MQINSNSIIYEPQICKPLILNHRVRNDASRENQNNANLFIALLYQFLETFLRIALKAVTILLHPSCMYSFLNKSTF